MVARLFRNVVSDKRDYLSVAAREALDLALLALRRVLSHEVEHRAHEEALEQRTHRSRVLELHVLQSVEELLHLAQGLLGVYRDLLAGLVADQLLFHRLQFLLQRGDLGA